MKALHTLRFVTEATKTLTNYQNLIANAEDFSKARSAARQMLGYIDCLITFNNTMICFENNDFTGELGEVIDDWIASVYDTLANKAIETKQDSDTVAKLLSKRDEHMSI